MRRDNPFNNLNALPDRPVTAWAAVCAWLGLAALLWRFGHRPFNWVAALAASIHAIRMWVRFYRRRSGHPRV